MKQLATFGLKLIAYSGILWAVHYYILFNFFPDTQLYFPLWTIYVFNTVLVFIVYAVINQKVSKGSEKAFQIFLILTMIKMVLAIVFLLPVFTGKVDNMKLEVFNFFIPYFFFLGFEIFALNKFFQNLETK